MTAILRYALNLHSPDPAIILISAFPLEHEYIDPPIEPAFSAAQHGLISYYARALDVAPLPSSFGKNGWLYKSTLLPDE